MPSSKIFVAPRRDGSPTQTPIMVSVAALVLSTLVACAPMSGAKTPASASVNDIGAGFGPAVNRDLNTLRTATSAFHNLAAAQAVGYPVATPKCIADSTMGGMGQHYFDRAVYDSTLKIEHPEMLLYAQMPDGKLKFVAVEYVVPFRLVPSTATPPRLFGQEFRRHEEFKYWYLHVWAWDKNPAGLFADWNPNIKCA